MKWDSYHDGFVMVEENLVMEEGRVFGRFGVIVSLSLSLFFFFTGACPLVLFGVAEG